MKPEIGSLVIAGTFLFICIIWALCNKDSYPYSEAYKALRKLKNQLDSGTLPPNIDYLDPARVIMVQYLPNWREGYESLGGTEPSKWWGTVGDSKTPYQFSHGGAWPPGMYSRLRQWSPGYDTTSNWSWAFRPGLKYKKWPRARWVAHDSNYYYYINNQQFF